MNQFCISIKWLVSITLMVWIFVSEAGAADCKSAAMVAGDVWKQYRNVTETLGCQTKLGGALEYGLCAPTRLLNESLEDVVGWWNTVAKNRWATLGPRTLGAERQTGTVITPTKRTFISMVPSFNKGTIVVTRKKGKGKVTICAVDDNGKYQKLFNDAEVSKKKTFNISKANAEGKILAVIIQSKSASFAYEIVKNETPTKWNFGPIDGFADLHNHMAAELGFAGLWLRGKHDWPQNASLESCRVLDLRDVISPVAQLAKLPVIEKEKLHALPLNEEKHEKERVLRHGHGYTNGKNKFKDWPHFSDIAHQQVHTDWLKEAHNNGLQLLVVSAVNNELLCRALRLVHMGKNDYACDDMSNIKRQLEAYNALDKKYDWFEIALTPWHARKIIDEKKLAVVLSAESSHMLPASENDFKAQLDELYRMGLRSLQIVHERDNSYAGAAPHRKNFWPHQITSNPFTAIKAVAQGDGTPFDLGKNGKNKEGLSAKGRELIDAMIQRRMLIDAAHYSAKTFNDVYKMVTEKRYNNYPIFVSHTRFKARLADEEKDLLKEFVTTDGQIEKIKNVGGIIGLRTGPNHITKDEEFDSGVLNDCGGSSKSYAQLVAHAENKNVNIAFGTDFNGVTQQISPRMGNDKCYAATKTGRGENKKQTALPDVPKRFNKDGLRHIGYLPDLYDELVALKTNGVTRLYRGAENFIKTWEKAYETKITKTLNSANECKIDKDCGEGKYCDAGIDLKNNSCKSLKANGSSCPLVNGGRVCQSGKCKASRCYEINSKNIGQSCFVGDECRLGKCNNVSDGVKGTCVCKNDTDCGNGKYCDAGVDLKQNTCRALKVDGSTCPLINGGRTCQSGKCKASRCYRLNSKNIGQSCYINGECRLGKCNNVSDGVRGTCVCNNDSDCGNDKYCDAGVDLKKNACRALKVDGSTCPLINGGRTCQSGKCKASRCYRSNSKNMGQSCYVNDECKKGKCNNVSDGVRGTCVCKNDSDCGSGFWCDGGIDLKKNVCKRKYKKGEVCGKVGDMKVGHRCKSGNCSIKGLSNKLVCK